MKYFILISTVLFLFSCKKETDSVQETLIANEWNATKFIVQNENTMAPDNSPILDAPVSFVQIRFVDNSNLTLQMELVDGAIKDNSGQMKMTYSLDEQGSTIDIVDDNWWTESASFTGKHKILLTDNNLSIDGFLIGDSDSLQYRLELVGTK